MAYTFQKWSRMDPRTGAGFVVDTNRVEIFTRGGKRLSVPLLPKTEVAERILDEVSALLAQGGEGGP